MSEDSGTMMDEDYFAETGLYIPRKPDRTREQPTEWRKAEGKMAANW